MSPWSIRSRKRRNGARFAVLLAMAAALVVSMNSAQAAPESEDAKAVADAIESFANRLSSASDALGNYSDLADNLPLSDLAPGSPEALDLSNLLKDKIGTLTSESMAALATEVEALDDTSGALKVQFGQGTLDATKPAVTATATSITIPIHAERHVDQKLEFAFGADVDMSGGSLGVDFELDTTLTFHVDSAAIVSAATAPPTALSLDPPLISLCAVATGSIGVFTARFGFTDVKVSSDNPATSGTTENATLHACAEVDFNDPDSTGGITLDEWTSAALTELATAEIVDGNTGGNDLDVTLYADASLVGGDAFATNTAADASISFTDLNLSDGFNEAPEPTINAGLGAWLNISAGDVANGLAQFVAGLGGAQNIGDARLPFLDAGLAELFNSDTMSGVKPLADYVERLTVATVGCGTTPGDADHFPSGFTDNLASGTLVYCRAATALQKQAGSVVWSIPTGVNATASCAECVNTSGAAANSTLGAAGAQPTQDAVFKMTSAGSFSVELTWDSDPAAATVNKTAIPRPGSAQELFERIADAAGLDDDLANLGYDAATKSLTFRLQKADFDPPSVDVSGSFGDLLRNSTSLAGLIEGGASFNAGVSDISFDLTFGVLLNDDTSDITPLRGTATLGSSATTLEDSTANFTDGDNDPRLGQVVLKTNDVPPGEDPPGCTITQIGEHTLKCASGITWASGDTYDVDSGLIDRFYIGIDPSAPEFAVGDIDVNGSATLKGTVGFLAVEAAVNTADDTMGIQKPAGADNVLAVDIKAPNPLTIDSGGSPTTIANAVNVGELLFNLGSDYVGVECNLEASASLDVSATVQGQQLAGGEVTVDWPTVFEADSCEPDFSTLDVDGDPQFDLNLRNFDPFPSVTGTHTANTSTNLFDGAKDFTKVGFKPGNPTSPTSGNNLLNLTLRNKTTGASCTILTVNANELQCTLSGGTRSGDDANKNKWKTGDEYEVEGNALAFLGYILDNLDELVEQIDQIDPTLTEKELPLVGISTKELVGKIKSIKETTDELRGSPAANIDCTENADGTNSEGFDIRQVPDGTEVYCRATTPDTGTGVTWTPLKGAVVVGAVVKADGVTPGDPDATVGPSGEDRITITVDDGVGGTSSPLTAVSDWQIKVEFTDLSGNHNAEFPTSSPPRSLQELEAVIEDKLGVDNVLKLDVLDLPAAGQAARTSGTASNGSQSDNVLEDSGAGFPSLAEANRPFVGNLLINKTDKTQCTITFVDTDTLTCAVGSAMQWDNNDEYEVVGNNTKDLVVRLGVGFCSGGAVTCAPTDRSVDPLEAPLNVADDFANIVAVQSQGTISLDYGIRAQLDLGISLKLGVPDIVVLDTTGAELEANLNTDDIGLMAGIGPLEVKVGKAVTDGVGIGKIGARLAVEAEDNDIANDKAMSLSGFLSDIDGVFEGTDQECGEAPGTTAGPADACAVLTIEALGTNFGEITIECNVDTDPICDAELPQALEDLISGEALDWSLLIDILPEILANLERTLDGASQDISLPLVGDALDAGANVVGVFNDNVVTPFSNLVNQLETVADQDGDSDVDAYDLAKAARQFVFTQLGPSSSANLLLDTNGTGSPATIDDVVVTPLCGTPATVCADGHGVTTSDLVRDFRVTFKIGQAIDGEVPFDIGLDGLPLRLTGGVHGAGSWSLLIDFGLSFDDGPYIVANGKKGFTGTENRPFDVDTTEPPDGTNDAHSVATYLQDDSTDFTANAELGMWLKNTSTNAGCRVTKIELHKLYCDDFGTGTAGSVTWDGNDGYELIARHAPDVGDPAGGSAPELSLTASVSMGNLPEDAGFTCTDASHDYPAGDPEPSYLAGFSNERCLAGQLAFLTVTIRDKAGTLDCNTVSASTEDPTALCLTASLDFKKTGGNRVSLSDVLSGDFDVDPRLEGDANVDVRFRTGLSFGGAGFPSVLGKFHLFWGFDASPSDGLDFADLDISFDGLTLDAGQFITTFLGPIVKQIKEVTNPLMPVVEMLQGEVPIISDLSKMIGEGPVTVLDVLEAISGNDLSLLRSILQMVKFVNSLPTNGSLLIPLGGTPGQPGAFDIDGEAAGDSPTLPEDADKAIENADGGTNLIDQLGAPGSPYAKAKDPSPECDRGSTFGVCGLTFPMFGDASEIFGVLMGKDATMIHYDAGTFGAGAGFGFCFPPILLGPVPVQICIGGSFRVEGRFAIGYDTSGLRKLLSGGTGTALLDGIYLDDYDANGADVPEVKFTGTVYAEGAVSVYIFKVGIRGEIIFTTGLNLHEDQPQDGKLRIEEIISKIFNPLCLFDVEGKIEAALSVFVKIDLFITSVEFSFTVVKITLLEFKLDVCNVVPVLAKVVDAGGGVEHLRLNMGSAALRTERGIAPAEINEKFTVRQMESYTSGPNNGKTRFSVTAFGIQQDYFLTTSKIGTANAKLIANAEDGDDVISLLPGSASGEASNPNQQKPPIPFTLWADVNGGANNDELNTGDGKDTVNGQGGNDIITTAAHDDTVSGGGENDNIDAGAGTDTVNGNDGNDVANGGANGDTVDGDAGDDVLSAGPGENAKSPSVDSLIGDAGNDTLNADGGGDKLWGDESSLSFDCSQDGSTDTSVGNGSDSLIGGKGADQMHGGNGADSLDGSDEADKMCGGGGNDEMDGGVANDTMFGGGGDDNMIGGADTDTMNGGGDRDYMVGDFGSLVRSGSVVTVDASNTGGSTDTMNGDAGRDFMWGQGGNDTMNGGTGNDEMHGSLGTDTMNGDADDDEMYGDEDVDTMHGNDNDDYMRGGPFEDVMDGDAGNDEMYGDGERDVMRGGANDDLMRGGGADDYIEGNGNDTSALTLDNATNPLDNANFDLHLSKDGSTGAWTVVGGNDGDVIYGDGGQDDIIGGSSSAAADGGDTILGNVAQDVIVGDNGTITRPGGNDFDLTTTRAVTLLDPAGATAGESGADWIQGNDENDDVYAGGGGDLVHGDAGDDYVEGNGGADGAGVLGGPPVAAIGVYGDAGQDDLIGGTSQGDGAVGDGGDDIWGGASHDVIAGDNADVTRASGSDCPAEPDASAGYDCNTFRDAGTLGVEDVAGDVVKAVIRTVVLADVDDQTAGDPAAGNSGGDTIGGQEGHDRIYGQGGDDDLKGDGNDDFAFGNAGADTIRGGDGQDDLVGGTGRKDSSSAASAEDGRIDAGDLIYGEDDFDAISGDNSRMVRQTQDVDSSDDTGLWKANTFNNAVDRLIALMDVATTDNDAPLTNGTSGGDRLLGGDEDDVIYGQGANDGITGGEGQDLLEGNANDVAEAAANAPNPDPLAYPDTNWWPDFKGDVIHGDAGADDIGGGTGRIYRMVAGVETQDPASGVDGRKDAGDTIFGDGGGDAIAGDNTVIERALQGGQWVLDDLHDPDALDVVRRVLRLRDVATTTDLAPLTNGTSGGDVIYGNDGVDVAYGQGGDDQIQGNAHDDHLEGNAGDETIAGGLGRDDVIGGTGRTFSNDESTAADGRIDNAVGDDAPNDTLSGGDGSGGVASDDDDTIIGDNGTVDRVLGTLGSAGAELNRLPFNGTWGETTWNAPNIRRVVRLLDVARTGATAPEDNGTNGNDTIAGEADDDVIFGEGGADTITGAGGEDYVEGNGGGDTIQGDADQDDITGGGSANHAGGANSLLDANRDGRLDDGRVGETLRDGADTIEGDSGDGAIGAGDVVAGDNARIQRLLASGVWRDDSARGTRLRDVFLFDIRIVGDAEPGNAAPGESGADAIDGNGGNDILLGQDNGVSDTAAGDAHGTENGLAGDADCQTATGGPGSGTLNGSEEQPNGDNDNDDLPDLNDPQCRASEPGDKINGETGQDYIEGNSGSDTLRGNENEDDVVGGSSSNTGHLNVILPAGDRDAGFAPGNLDEASKPNNLNDGHDVLEGNGEDDTVVGDNAFVDRYLQGGNAWITISGPGGGPYPASPVPNPEPARDAWTPTEMIRRDVTTKATKEVELAFGHDYARGGDGKDDVYGLLGNDWLEGNDGEDAILGDMGKIVDNQLNGPTPDTVADPSPLNQFIAPQQPFLGATINLSGQLKREVTLYAFDQSLATAGIGHDVALGGVGNDWIHTGPGEDLANGNAGDDKMFLGDNATATTAQQTPLVLAHDKVDAGWGGAGHDIMYGGYGADYMDVRPRSTAAVPGLFPTSDPETWFQVAGAEASHNGVLYGQQNFEGIDYLYGGWDQDTLQANEGDNGPVIGDRLLDWSGSYNGYYLCPATYGDWVSTRAIAPGLIEFLQQLSQGNGATTTATAGTSGFRETAIVFSNEAKFNTKPIHADTPAHFTCGAGTVTP